MAAVALVGWAALLRLTSYGSAYELFVDEITYARISESVEAQGDLLLYGRPFFLHPPLYFLTQGSVLELFETNSDVFVLVDTLRLSNIAISLLVAVALCALLVRSAGPAAGLLALALYAIDPFMNRYNGRVMIETLVALWVVLGYLALTFARSPRHGRHAVNPAPHAERRPLVVGVISGLFFGCAALTKETSVALYVVPLLVSAVWPRVLSRYVSVIALLTTVATYCVYPVTVLLSGRWPQYFEQKFRGIQRMVGIVQETGFNRPEAPSFIGRLLANVPLLGGSYVLIGLGVLAAVVLARRGDPRMQLLSLWFAGAAALLAYQMLFGTLEEHMFFYLVLPSLATVPAACPVLLRGSSTRGHRSRVTRAAVGIVLVALVAVNAVSWSRTNLERDDGFRMMTAWIRENVEPSTRIAALADTSQFLLRGYGVLSEPDPAELERLGAEYVVTSSAQVERGYGRATPATVDWLRTNADIVYQRYTRTSGNLIVWRLR
ncbi:ArnT family glycosyltransferase [Blastococcus sp. SYSU DS0973]